MNRAGEDNPRLDRAEPAMEPGEPATEPGVRVADTVAQLRRMLEDYEHRRREGRAPGSGERPVVRSGLAALDAALPRGGFLLGSVVELLSDLPGAGATEMALRIARAAGALPAPGQPPLMGHSASAPPSPSGVQVRPVVVVDTDGDFYPPAAARLGFDLTRLIVVRPREGRAALVAVDECLRCPAVAAVVAGLHRLGDVSSRRLQLAAESAGGLGLILRPAGERGGERGGERSGERSGERGGRGRKSFAAVQMLIEPVERSACGAGPDAGLAAGVAGSVHGAESVRRVWVTLLHVREGMPGGPLGVTFPDETRAVSVSAGSGFPGGEESISRAVG